MNQTLASVDLGSTLTAVEDAGLFSSLCTIQEPDGTRDATGNQKRFGANFGDVAGMVDIPCMIAPEITTTVLKSSETRDQDRTNEMAQFHVLLDGYYPLIRKKMRAVIDGKAWDITGVESDSQKIMTRMAVREYA